MICKTTTIALIMLASLSHAFTADEDIEVIEMKRTSTFTSSDEIEICLSPNNIEYKLKLPSVKGCRWEQVDDEADSQLLVGQLTSGNYMIRAFPDFEEETLDFDYLCGDEEEEDEDEEPLKTFTVHAILC